ncbi:MAG TPA: OFA family MFS transporter [Pirellulales bacterium]|nr:OFA family MFS transporter [Pirellulales bacterium]
MGGFFSKERITAPPAFNRWRVPPASIAIHLCIGSVYAWSVFNPPLMKLRGVVTSAAGDWSLTQVTWIFTVAIVSLGLSAAVAGRWMERVGPRTVGLAAAACWGAGFLVSALGTWLHQLPLLYLGYGVIGGIGLGLGYVSPVSTLIKWFPDRRGMATGLAIMGFGGGAMIAAPLNEGLIRFFYRAPEFLGNEGLVRLSTDEQGVRHADLDGWPREVVVVGAKESAKMIKPGPPGVYAVGTGGVGVTETFLALGGVYFIVMVLAAMSYRLPAADWRPPGWEPTASHAARKMISSKHVAVGSALRTPQFYLLWLMLCFNVTAGIAVLGVAKTMMTDMFASALPQIVTAGFATVYVQMTSAANMVGRFFWSTASDRIGRKTTYSIFFFVGAASYLSIPWIANQLAVSGSPTWLVVFYCVTMLIFTMYGGGFATIPAYLADLFGSRHVAPIHGILLTAWSTAGVLGPIAITSLREREVHRVIGSLTAAVAPADFETKFGAPLAELPALIKSNSVTIAKLMEIVPSGTPDPSSTLYNSTMCLMAGLLAIAFLANLFVVSVESRHHLDD